MLNIGLLDLILVSSQFCWEKQHQPIPLKIGYMFTWHREISHYNKKVWRFLENEDQNREIFTVGAQGFSEIGIFCSRKEIVD